MNVQGSLPPRLERLLMHVRAGFLASDLHQRFIVGLVETMLHSMSTCKHLEVFDSNVAPTQSGWQFIRTPSMTALVSPVVPGLHISPHIQLAAFVLYGVPPSDEEGVHEVLRHLFESPRWCVTLETLCMRTARIILEGMACATRKITNARLVFGGGLGLNEDGDFHLRYRLLERSLFMFLKNAGTQELDLFIGDPDPSSACHGKRSCGR